MNFEQKYKYAIEQAKKELEACGSLDCDAARQIFRLFPELEEIEENKIIDALKLAVRSYVSPTHNYVNTILKSRLIYWLEKQGEHNNFAPKSATEAIKEEKIDNANKVEPKFKVGDWIIHKESGNLHQIIKCCNNMITLDNCTYFSDFWAAECYRLWTIQDAKKGDILQANKCTLIFDSLAKDIDGNQMYPCTNQIKDYIRYEFEDLFDL